MNTPRYCVFSDDNFHFMDDSERDEVGAFSSYDEALECAKQRVERSVAHHKFDYEAYTDFGDDPFVRPTPEGVEPFSRLEIREGALCGSSGGTKLTTLDFWRARGFLGRQENLRN